ncbi:MAG: HIT family protein [Patescibacteria group bacterium]
MACPFCFEVEPERVVKENELARAIICAEPLNGGHVLIFPRRHVEHVSDLTAPESKALFDLVGLIETALPKVYEPTPIVFMNTGNLKTQPHLHIHVLPSKGGIRHLFSTYENIPFRLAKPMSELAVLAERIKSEIAEEK